MYLYTLIIEFLPKPEPTVNRNYRRKHTSQAIIKLKNIFRYLSSLQQAKTSIPWTQLRKLSKAERQAIKISKLKDKEAAAPTSSTIFVTGINAVTRGLEKKCLNSVLLDSHVEPVLIKHIVVMCEADNIPIVLVPFLKSITSGTIGFKTAAFALKVYNVDLYEIRKQRHIMF